MNTNGTDKSAIFQPPRGERPRLLPYNRKLRHLQGVTLRNLWLHPASKRARGKTIDDEALPYALKSPGKLLDSNEDPKLSQSRSFTNLKAHGAILEDEPNGHIDTPVVTPTKSHQRIKSMRRRSTLDWMSATPNQKLRSLEDKVSRHTADVFFTLHVNGQDDPVYISEVVTKAMNPNFRFFDLNACSAVITRRSDLVIKFWTRTNASDRWILLIELTLNLKYMQFIGKSLESFHHPFPENCVLLHLSDGIYTAFTDMLPASDVDSIVLPITDTVANFGEPTSSYDALRKLQTLDECIQDAIATREKLAAEINAFITSDKERFFSVDEVAEARDRFASTRRALASERRLTKVASARAEELRSSIRTRREAMATGTAKQTQGALDLVTNRERLEQNQTAHRALLESATAQRRRICSDLLNIYPIEPIPNKTLAFTIRKLHLPNSDFKSATANDDEIDAALGYVAHLVHLLSFYLATPLPYPVHPCSSVSSIADPISLMPSHSSAAAAAQHQAQPNRTFPLHLGRGSGTNNSVPFFRFEYGVFLLNKDIELLAAKQGLRVLDIRQTLPNLMYLLYVVTAGTGGLPGRKAGGVRGLMRDWSMERRGSEDSAAWSSSTAVEDDAADGVAGNVREKGKAKALS